MAVGYPYLSFPQDAWNGDAMLPHQYFLLMGLP